MMADFRVDVANCLIAIRSASYHILCELNNIWKFREIANVCSDSVTMEEKQYVSSSRKLDIRLSVY